MFVDPEFRTRFDLISESCGGVSALSGMPILTREEVLADIFLSWCLECSDFSINKKWDDNMMLDLGIYRKGCVGLRGVTKLTTDPYLIDGVIPSGWPDLAVWCIASQFQLLAENWNEPSLFRRH